MSESHLRFEEKASQSLSTDRKKNPNWKLDPSLLVCQNSAQASHKMTLRRRGIKCQSSTSTSVPSIPEHETILPLNSTYLPKEEARDGTKTHSGEYGPDDGKCNRHQTLKNEKIFSITTYVALFITLIAFCLCVCNKASLLVSAQYSNFALTPNSNDHHHHQHHSNRRSAQQSINRQSVSADRPVAYPQRPVDSLNRDLQAGANVDQVDERRWLKKNSIDRYDSGEQIRPPLLKQPTTLPPLRSAPLQASVNNQNNLQEAASQESYLTPGEREQLSKNQDSHYEGKNLDPASSPSYDGFSSDRDGYDSPQSGRWSQPLPDAPEPPISEKQGSLEYQPSRPEPSTATSGSSAENDDGDYEEEPSESDKKRKENLVPEMRRRPQGATSGAASHNHQRPSMAQSRAAVSEAKYKAAKIAAAKEAALNEDGDPNDDYGGGSDESHFSRKSQQQDRSPGLNQAASHNQQLNRGPHHGGAGRGGGGGPQADAQRDSSGSDSGPQDEVAGFGPNEAYMVDKADVGKDQDGDESLYGPSEGPSGDPNGLGANEEAIDSRFDRRSMNPYQAGASNSGSYGSNPSRMNYGQQQRPVANLIDNGDPEGDSEDGNDASDESGSSFAPSVKTEVKSRAAPSSQPIGLTGSNSNNLSPRTSASAPAPQSATFSHSSSPIVTVPSPMLGGAQPMMSAGNAQPFYRQQVHSANNVATTTQPTLYQRASLDAPYNPQNNPSHAGKYFIN